VKNPYPYCPTCGFNKGVGNPCIGCKELRRLKQIETSRLNYVVNKERVLARQRVNRTLNAEAIAAYHRKLYIENREEILARNKLWRTSDRGSIANHKRRARIFASAGSHSIEEWQAILELFGRRCAHCRGKARGNLQKDHVIPLSRGGSNFAFNLQPLCRTCNLTKFNKIKRGAQHSLFDRLEVESCRSIPVHTELRRNLPLTG